jgi:hypothetical protein
MHILLTLQIPVLPCIEQILFIVSTFSEQLHPSANTGRMLPAIAGREERLRQFCFSLLIGGDTEQENVRGVLGNKCAGHHNITTVKVREIM